LKQNIFMSKRLLQILLFTSFTFYATAQKINQYKVVAYYSGDSATLPLYHFDKITHLIYSFGHVKDGSFYVRTHKDTAALLAVQQIKKQHPKIKIMISLGGWGGCDLCSQTFNDKKLTSKFVASVKSFLKYYHLDGIDLDWEYPSLPGFPGHQYLPQDRSNFTNLVRELRIALGPKSIISFAAGGLKIHLDSTIEWNKIKNKISFVNLMSYDLVHGYSQFTGHHTPLYSSYPNEESVDRAVQYLRKINFPMNKVIIGAGFYYREFEAMTNTYNGLYQAAKFRDYVPYNIGVKRYVSDSGYVFFWSTKNKSPYWFNSTKHIFATAENKASVTFKCDYVKKNKLGGIMFWELYTDTPEDGLLDAIDVN
jgi:chitinase